MRGKLSPSFIWPFEITKQAGPVGYRLALPVELSWIHDVFHVSMLRKYISDPSHILQTLAVEINDYLSYDEQLVQILDQRE